jgi:hypothetical protein
VPTKTGKCAALAKQRKRQKKYVSKSPAAQRARVKANYRKNKSKIAAAKKRSKTKQGGKMGRPRTC